MVSTPGVYKRPEDFRVLFVYPNVQMTSLAPQGIGYLSGMLKREGFTVDLFDTTFYINDLTGDSQQQKVYLSIVRPFSWEERGITPKQGDMLQDFQDMVDSFQPDLLAFSVVENTWRMAAAMMDSLDRHVPTIVGGVFPTYAPDYCLSHPRVDYICRGEGELPMVALCKALAAGEDTSKIPSIWSKSDGQIHKNRIGVGINLDELPLPDWSLFDDQSLYRPMQGRVYKTIGVETQRGCPYTCTFCNSPSNNVLYKGENAGHFYRKKSVARVAEELDRMVDEHNPEFIYFVVDTFLAMGDRELAEFSEMYQSFKIPFWMNTRAETVNEWRADELEKMNCLRMNIGVEHGNPQYREKILKRRVSNERMYEAFNACSGRSFTTVANSIIGMPDENRDLIFDTIEFSRNLPKDIDASGAFMFTPYHGTALREYAIQQGYMDPGTVCEMSMTSASMLNMPGLSAEEIQGLARVFSFYVKMDHDRFDDIQVAEAFTPEGDEMFLKLREEFQQSHWRQSVDPKEVSSFDLVIGSDEWKASAAGKQRVLTGEDFSDLHG